MNFQHMLRFIFILTLAGLVAACGFQLRGVGGTNVPDEWKRLHLVTSNPNSEFTRAVIGRFAANGVEWLDAQDANFSLKLYPEKFEKRNLSLNAEARVSEIELTMSSRFLVLDAATSEEVMPEATVSVVKLMENDPRNAVGKEGELRLVQNEMRQELAEKVMRRIGFFATSDQSQPATP